MMYNWLKHHANKLIMVLGLIFAKADSFLFVPRTQTALELSDSFRQLSYKVCHWSQNREGVLARR